MMVSAYPLPVVLFVIAGSFMVLALLRYGDRQDMTFYGYVIGAAVAAFLGVAFVQLSLNSGGGHE